MDQPQHVPGRNTDVLETTLAAVKNELAGTDRQKNRLYELLELGEYDLPLFRERMAAVKEKRAALEKKEAELERSLSGNPALEIVVRGEGEAVQSQLALLSGITSLTQHDCPEANCCAFRLESTPDQDLREAVFQTCARQGLPLLELRRDTLTLEDIFLKLTSDDVEEERDESSQTRSKEEKEAEQ